MSVYSIVEYICWGILLLALSISIYLILNEELENFKNDINDICNAYNSILINANITYENIKKMYTYADNAINEIKKINNRTKQLIKNTNKKLNRSDL